MGSVHNGGVRSAPTKSHTVLYLVYAGIAVLLVLGAMLPPVSLATRIANIGYRAVGPQGVALKAADGAQAILLSAAGSGSYVRLDMISRAQYEASTASKEVAAARAALPPNLTIQSGLYHLSFHGPLPNSTSLRIPIPSDVASTTALDLYGWDGKEWRWLPASVWPQERAVVSQLSEAVPYVALVVAVPVTGRGGAAPGAGTAGAEDLTGGASAPPAVAPQADCGVRTVAAPLDMSSATGPVALGLATDRTSNGVADPSVISDLLSDPALSARHASAIADWAASTGAPGVTLEYLGLDPALRDAFTGFVKEVRARMADKRLVVRVPAAHADGSGWNTGAYDWATLGALSDLLVVLAPDDPRACAPDRDLSPMLTWATSQVNRLKLAVAFNALSEDLAGTALAALKPIDEAVAPLNSVRLAQGKAEILPGQSVTLDANAKDLQLDGRSNAYFFEYPAPDGSTHTVWLEDNATLTRKLVSVVPFNLGQVLLLGVDASDAVTQQMLLTLVRFGGAQGDIAQQPASVIWTVQNSQGTPVAQSTSVLPDVSFQYSSNDPGIYSVSAAVAVGGRSLSSRGDRLPLNIVTLTPTPTPTPTSSPTPSPTPTSTVTNTPLPTDTAAPKPTAPAAPAAPSAPSGPAPSGGTGFAFGIQAHYMSQGDHARVIGAIQQLGFTWTKQQVEWQGMEQSKGNIDWGRLDRMVNDCAGAGLHIMLSVVKAPMWARPGDTDRSVGGPPANPQDYANFIGAMAARYRGRVQAYEVWNEENLYYEWGGRGHRLDAGAYVTLLRFAFGAIKAADPGATVVSGALTPTGWNDGDTAVDDAVYLEEMYLNGVANYCDAVGVHPSGFNNPPDATVGYDDPNRPGFKGHRSFFFRATMERYREIMVAYGDGWKRLWPTEFGWASVDGLGAPPAAGYEYAMQISANDQANYIVRAYQMARNWGWVGPMFLWNLNFGPVAGAHDEKAAFGILRPDWSPRPAYNALAGMAK